VPVHERVVCEPPIGRLCGYVIHDSIASEEEAREKTRVYAELGAEILRASGRGGVGPALLHAAWAFARGFLLKAGFLDGAIGWMIAREVTRRTWLRYHLAAKPAGSVGRDHRNKHGRRPHHRSAAVFAKCALFVALMLSTG
jgi:hypothetical protein